VFSDGGVAIDNPDFVVASASFNAIAADAARTLGDLLADKSWRVRGAELTDALDHAAWDEREKLWRDVAFAGPPMSEATLRVPTLDAALPALCTADRTKAENAIAQFSRPDRFFAPYGLRFLPPNHPSYNPAQYWRGPTWPQLNYLAALAARHCGLPALANDIAQTTKRAVLRARFSEYWNPETGRGLGARPQTWAAVVAAM
jgi:glycogen debranching enzyme